MKKFFLFQMKSNQLPLEEITASSLNVESDRSITPDAVPDNWSR